MLETELRKAFGNIWFFIALAIGSTLALVSAVNNITGDYQQSIKGMELIESKWIDFSSSSTYHYWIVTDFIQPSTGLFFLLLPLLAVLPYAWSYCSEKNSGYVKNILTRASKEYYFFSKYFAVFLSGALVITIPIVLNFLVCACFLPTPLPDVFGVIHFGIYEKHLWSEIFYNNPFLYCLLFTGMNFAFAGLWAVTTYALSFFIKNRVVLTITPFLFLLFVKFTHDNVLLGLLRTEITPFTFLRGTGTNYTSNGYFIAIVLLLLLVFSLVVTHKNMRRDIV